MGGSPIAHHRSWSYVEDFFHRTLSVWSSFVEEIQIPIRNGSLNANQRVTYGKDGLLHAPVLGSLNVRVVTVEYGRALEDSFELPEGQQIGCVTQFLFHDDFALAVLLWVRCQVLQTQETFFKFDLTIDVIRV